MRRREQSSAIGVLRLRFRALGPLVFKASEIWGLGLSDVGRFGVQGLYVCWGAGMESKYAKPISHDSCLILSIFPRSPM